jgi:hypothetical protein
MAELYEEYQKWCRKLTLRPVRAKEFMQMAKAEIETGFGLRPRHDLVGKNRRARRGWSGLTVLMQRTGETILYATSTTMKTEAEDLGEPFFATGGAKFVRIRASGKSEKLQSGS